MNTTKSLNHHQNLRKGDSEFVIGDCATCGSTVRWPRQLNVYRCTVCLMVNDLTPSLRKENDRATDANSNSNPHQAPSTKKSRNLGQTNPILSVETTRVLIERAVSSYLYERIQYRKSVKPSVSSDFIHDEISSNPMKRPSWQAQAGVFIPYSQQQQSETYSEVGSLFETTASTALKVSIQGRKKHESSMQNQSHPATNGRLPIPQSIPQTDTKLEPARQSQDGTLARTCRIFHLLENYLLDCLADCGCLNKSFITGEPVELVISANGPSPRLKPPRKLESNQNNANALFEIDGKTLLLGDVGENGMWWTKSREHFNCKPAEKVNGKPESVEYAQLRLDLSQVKQWYETILACGYSWKTQKQALSPEERYLLDDSTEEEYIETRMAEARHHVQRTLLKVTENLLRRPGKPLRSPADCRFLLIVLCNPLFYTICGTSRSGIPELHVHPRDKKGENIQHNAELTKPSGRVVDGSSRSGGIASGHHSGIVKRLLGLIANLPFACHQSIISSLYSLSEPEFRKMVELIGGFVSYRLERLKHRKQITKRATGADLIPEVSDSGSASPAQIHATIRGSRMLVRDTRENRFTYYDDWQILVSAKVMSLFFLVNNSLICIHKDNKKSRVFPFTMTSNRMVHTRTYRRFQKLPICAFYNTSFNHTELIDDFEMWESSHRKFTFCQYPMFLSIWAKIQILEHDARRQMERKAQDAFFASLLSRKSTNQFLVLKVRRHCLADDSLRSMSEVVGSGQDEVKKSLKIKFINEEGVDAGGLRKEWFLLLVREVFDPNHGLFVYDEDSRYCYFNPESFEASDQFFLVGVVLGLAIYNSTILDVAFPPFTFRKLLASAPDHTRPDSFTTRPSNIYTLDDLSEWKPSLARGLQQMLDYDGEVENIYCRDFVIDIERYGETKQIPLCPNGEIRPVTNQNRHEFVDLYLKYLIDTAVARQYEPFKRGFFTVCKGNALSLFRPEEIELLVRGSDELLDVSSLRAIATYEGWPPRSISLEDGYESHHDAEPLVAKWFWELFESAGSRYQRKLLGFVTGSDRIPATGVKGLAIKLSFLTEDYRRYPVARTCFNTIGLHQYRSKDELGGKLWRAVEESEGFGLR